jgi:hypothetical protein
MFRPRFSRDGTTDSSRRRARRELFHMTRPREGPVPGGLCRTGSVRASTVRGGVGATRGLFPRARRLLGLAAGGDRGLSAQRTQVPLPGTDRPDLPDARRPLQEHRGRTDRRLRRPGTLVGGRPNARRRVVSGRRRRGRRPRCRWRAGRARLGPGHSAWWCADRRGMRPPGRRGVGRRRRGPL